MNSSWIKPLESYGRNKQHVIFGVKSCSDWNLLDVNHLTNTFLGDSRRIKAYTPGVPQTDHPSPEPGVQPGENETLHQSGNWPTWPLQPMLRSQCNLHSSGKSALFQSPNLAIGSSSSSQRPTVLWLPQHASDGIAFSSHFSLPLNYKLHKVKEVSCLLCP